VPTLDSHKWLPFGILFTFLVGLGLIPFVRRLPRDTARLFLAAGFLFVLGAIGFELLGTWMLSSGFVESRQELPYLLRRVAEEGLEMYAIAMFNIAIYRELSRNEVSVLIDSSGGAA
jgi:predicted permease